MRNLTSNKKLKLLVNITLIASVATVLGLGLLSFNIESNLNEYSTKKNRLNSTLKIYEELTAALLQRESGLIAYFSTKNSNLMPKGLGEKITLNVRDLNEIYQDMPQWDESLQNIENIIKSKTDLQLMAYQEFAQGNESGAIDLLNSETSKDLTSQFRRNFSEWILHQEEQLAQQEYPLGIRTSVFLHIIGCIFASTIIVICIVLFNDDFRRREKVEAELLKTKEEALRSSKAKSEFISKMSHEIRTPLNAIIGGADALSRLPQSEEQGAYIRLMQKASDGLYAIVGQILDLTKIESGRMDLKKQSFNIRNLLEAVKSIFSMQAKEKNILLSLEIDPKMPNYIILDPDKLRQILINLVGNAVKFTEKGQISIKLSCFKERFQIRISDTGIGISESDIKQKLFKKFSQCDDSITRNYGGSGLGLVISKELAELMGGKINIASQIGEGTEFSLDFPLHEGEQNPLKYYERENRPIPTSSLRILIVDDSEDNLHLLQLYLKDENYELVFARNGQEAYNFFQREKFDLVFMDVHMPIMDGYTATNKIRGWEARHNIRKTPIIALTADALKEDFDRSLQAGCNSHLTKPVKKFDLIHKIEEYARTV